MPGQPPRQRGGTYLLTWTTYATWLPGHHEGFVGRVPTLEGHPVHNQPGTPFDADQPRLTRAGSIRQQHPRVVLSRPAARVALDSFRRSATDHELQLLAAAVLPTHAHVVVRSPSQEGARLLNLFKGAASRRMSIQCGRPEGGRWWTKSGSRRLLTSNDSVRAAIRYVLAQENPLVIWHDADR